MLKVKFTPQPLISCQKLFWMASMGVFQVVDAGDDITFAWNYVGTKFNKVPNAINGNCTDTSKSHVDHIFEKVYGYSSAADKGWAVEKPDYTNGNKDCKLVNLDKEPKKPDHFYQKLLLNGDSVIEYRYVVMNFTPVYCLVKHKRVQHDNLPGVVKTYDVSPIVNIDHRLELMCELFGMNYGEMDVIWHEGRQYVIDMNPTPGDAAFVRMPAPMKEQFINDYKHLTEKWLTSLL